MLLTNQLQTMWVNLAGFKRSSNQLSCIQHALRLLIISITPNFPTTAVTRIFILLSMGKALGVYNSFNICLTLCEIPNQ